MIITIDGPAASGKSTATRKIADELGYFYLYTGLLYRALAYLLIKKYGYTEIDFSHPRLADVVACLDQRHVTYEYTAQLRERIFWQGEDITPLLQAMGQYASMVSAHGHVRDVLLQYQRAFAQQHNLVADGRDCGSVVFPQAHVKFFVTASDKVRAQRWQHEQRKRGIDMTFESALAELSERDKRDSQRVNAPLIIPAHAIIVDTSDLTPEQTVEIMLRAISSSS